MSKMRVLVLDGNQNQAVAAVRSLARAGFEPWVGASTSLAKAAWSRWCRGRFRYSSPEDDATAFIDDICALLAERPGTLVMPMTERTTLPVSDQRERILKAQGRLVLPSHETVLCAFDKSCTTAIAEALDVRVPWTVEVSEKEHALEVARAADFPVVLKPQSSEEVVGGRVLATGGPRYATDSTELLTAFDEVRARSSRVLVQEFIGGSGSGYYALMRHGELRAEFAHRRIRDVRPTGSGSSLRESVRPDPAVRQAALGILQRLGWHGVAMVEFRLTPDGVPVFLEVNGRFWNSLALAIHAGVDFPALLAKLAMEGDIPPSAGYRAGVRCRWLLGDLQHLVGVWRGPPVGYPGPFPGRWRTTLDVLRPVPGTAHDNFSWRDPLPGFADVIEAFRKVVARGKRGRREKRGDPPEGFVC